MSGDVQVRFCERRGARFPPATHLTIEGRKVARWRDYLDPLAVFDALGWPQQPR
jgi:hypothetical protein